jgi:MobA/MobL family
MPRSCDRRVPRSAPFSGRARQQLWNAAEIAEKRRDSRAAREYEVAVPHELTKAQRTR